jgi:ribosomal protein L35
MRKSVSKRIKVTGTGKMIRRKMAQDHFKSKHPSFRTRNKRKSLEVYGKNIKIFKKYLNSNN